jgi:hypothetical protein
VLISRSPPNKEGKADGVRSGGASPSDPASSTASSRASLSWTTASTNSRDAIFLKADENQLQEIFQMKRQQRAMFLVLGVGTEIAALLALLAFFRRGGWF